MYMYIRINKEELLLPHRHHHRYTLHKSVHSKWSLKRIHIQRRSYQSKNEPDAIE